MKSQEFVLWFNDIGIEDVPLVGGKNASLGEMYQKLTKKKINIPDGFAVTAAAYRYFLREEGLEIHIRRLIHRINPKSVESLRKYGHEIREHILRADIPPKLRIAIIDAYRKLQRKYGRNREVAVRSSATAEDLPDASFAGQQETYLNVRGEAHLLEACQKCFASLFTNRAIHYRIDKNFNHFKVALSIGVQLMVRSDIGSSGIMFSIDTETGFRDVVLINSIYGLGENIVLGRVNPDEFYIHKPTLILGYKPILSKKLGDKKQKLIYSHEGSTNTTKNIDTSQKERESYAISEQEIITLAKWACDIEHHYRKPMDMEWAKDGITKKLYIVQARPETIQSRKDPSILEDYHIGKRGKIITKGRSVGSKIGSGQAQIVMDVQDMKQFKKGNVLVTDMTDPDWEPVMKIAAGIITNRGGRTCFDGETKVLTNQGFKTIKQIHDEGYEGLSTLSFNKITKKTEWKPIVASMRKQGDIMSVSVSQSGRILDNTLKLTPDHKMVNVRNAEITDTKIGEMTANKEMLCIAESIPSLNHTSEKEKKLAYLLGGILTDGSIYRSRTHGEVQFIQKDIPEKREFIDYMDDCMESVYHKRFSASLKKVSTGMIRGKPVIGQATAHRLYSKQIAYTMYEEAQKLVTTIITADEELAYNFLAGVIDGDGSFYNNRLHLYISKEELLQAVVVACLRIGTFPQISKNRNIANVQIVEKIDTLLSYTKRVNGQYRKRTIHSRLFSARQMLDDNAKGQFKLRRDKNLYISADNLKQLQENKIDKLTEGQFRMQRVQEVSRREYGDVYNLTVADNHTYLVFTKKLTPVIVNNCHAAIISRELGIPCIVGTNDATQKIRRKQKVTVSCAEGETGYIYEGFLKYHIETHNLHDLKKPRTKVMVNLGNPDQAFEVAQMPHEGIGLAREEFIINEFIKIHPKALINYDTLIDKEAKRKIEKLTIGYKNKKQYFIDKLSQGVATLAAAFYPKEVIVRLSDFKSNEYAHLIGGKLFEPLEDNPMIGWRGASRYHTKHYKDAFALECKALAKVRKEMGLKNVKIMVPFCRTVKEGRLVLKEMARNGLARHIDNLQVYVMCEIPSNIILADEFAKIFDGFSIGTNDLTQLTLGLDRDSELVADVYDEQNEAVKILVANAIHKARANKRHIGLCGEAGSLPDFAKFLVQQGIDSISVAPDALMKTIVTVLNAERNLKHK